MTEGTASEEAGEQDGSADDAERRWAAGSEEAEHLRRRAEGLWNRDYVERVLVPALAIDPGARALDVGTGFGALAFRLASVRPDLEIVGVDPESTLIEGARQAAVGLGLDRVRFEVGDGASLPFPDDAFDLVMCQTVLTHVPDAGAVVRDMARVLKPGGTFFAAEWSDRVLTAFPYDNAAGMTFEETQELFTLTRLYSAGRARLGRGDDAAGVRTPILAYEAGLDVVDVRVNDRVGWAVPPYGDERQRVLLEEARDWTESTDESLATWIAENITAAGGRPAEAERYLELLESDRTKTRWRGAIDAGTFAVVTPNVMILTIARKRS